MTEVDLLQFPSVKRNIAARHAAKTPEIVAESKKFGAMYFDGQREYGYGGYRYDGRWKPVARNIINHFDLRSGNSVLDVGCAKGFLVNDLIHYEINAYGLDISSYALACCMLPQRVVGGTAASLPFPNQSFDCVVAINTIHNLPRDGVIAALREIERVSRGRSFVQVDSYYTPEQREVFEQWVLTAEFHDYPDGWRQAFREAGYSGDYWWTIAG